MGWKLFDKLFNKSKAPRDPASMRHSVVLPPHEWVRPQSTNPPAHKEVVYVPPAPPESDEDELAGAPRSENNPAPAELFSLPSPDEIAAMRQRIPPILITPMTRSQVTELNKIGYKLVQAGGEPANEGVALLLGLLQILPQDDEIRMSLSMAIKSDGVSAENRDRIETALAPKKVTPQIIIK